LSEGLPTQISDAVRRRGMLFIGLAAGCVGFVLAVQMGLNPKFLADELHFEGAQVGALEAARESCGILALLVLAALAGVAEPLVGAAMLVRLGVGISGYYHVGSLRWIIPISLVWSMGLHVWMPLPQSMTLALAEPDKRGHRLGQTQAAGAVGFCVSLALLWALTMVGVPMRPFYLMAGVAALAGAAACLWIPRAIPTPGPRLILRKRYTLYYVMNFLEGWRKQIAIAFAGFLLAKVHQASLQTLLLLFGLPQVFIYLAGPTIGKIVDRVGERRTLVFYYVCLTAFFIGYATIPNKYVLYGIYVLDNAFFVLTVALSTYVSGIAPKEELTRTLSMGVAMNHVSAVTMPVVGGLLWAYWGYRWTFVAGAVAAVLSIGVALLIPKHVPHPKPLPPAPSEY